MSYPGELFYTVGGMEGIGKRIHREIEKVFIGKKKAVDLLLTGFFSGLAVLIEDIPGVGKTTLARSLSRVCQLDFCRIQFTPDLLPGDITGMTVWSPELRDFVYKPGAIMHQFVLADEINRTSTRTQAALLESLQEGSVSVDGKTYPLPQPFFLVATQNPLSFSGTFPLPEAQVDRFGLRIDIGYPEREQEERIIGLGLPESPFDSLEPVLSAQDVLEFRKKVRTLYVDRKVFSYIVSIAQATRQTPLFKGGISPRASQHLLRAAQGWAFLQDRDYVLPEDVRVLALPVLSHRLSLSPEARMRNRSVGEVLETILSSIPMPSGLE